MLERISQLTKSKLFRGSAVVFTANMAVNFLNYLYTVVMGRMLGPEKYGILVSLISVLTILFVPSLTLNTVIVKFSSKFNALKDIQKLAGLFISITRFIALSGAFVAFVIFVFSWPIAGFLKIDDNIPVVFLGILIFLSLLNSTSQGFIQGLLRFVLLSGLSVLQAALKLLLAVAFVFFGYGVSGALGALLLATLVAYILSLFSLRKLLFIDIKGVALETREVWLFTAPVFLSMLGLNLINNLDIILVKRFFAPHEAGLYAALSQVGKIIFYVVTSVSLVMFPIVSGRNSVGRTYKRVFYSSLLMTFVGITAILVVYFFFPEVVIGLIYGSDYLSIAPKLWLMGVFMSLVSVAYLFINFFLAIHRNFIPAVIPVFSLLQAILIYKYHGSLSQVISVSIFAVGFLLLLMSGYLIKSEGVF